MQHRILSEQLATALPQKEAAAAPAAPSATTTGLFGQPATGLFGTPGEDLRRCFPLFVLTLFFGCICFG